MRRKHPWSLRLLAVLSLLAILAAACGDDDDEGAETEGTGGDDTSETTAGPTQAGGEIIDGGTFVGDPPEHIDPALNVTLDAYQVVNALFDGLTEIDTTDPENPETRPLVAESFESNDDATVWTFTIRDGMHFSDGQEILPSTFQDSWERASDPDFAGLYSYLFNFIEGGAEKLEGTADTLTGVEADDEAMTLTVTLAAPYANFATVAGFQLFMPVPEAAMENPADFENGVMVGNGPYMMESARTDEEIVLVKNPEWTGDINGDTWDDRLDKITFRTFADPETAYAALEAAEVHTANIPPGRVTDAQENFGTTLDVNISGVYYFTFNDRDEQIGGDDNLLLRQAISQAIDRETINEQVYEGTRTEATGITPPGIPGYQPDMCDYCTYDAAAAQAAFDEWTANGGELTEPIQIEFNADAGHEDVVAIIVENLDAIGIDAESAPLPSEDYFTVMGEGGCTFCRSGWYADYPTYDNFTYDLFHQDALGGNNYGFINDEFDALVDEAKATVDADAAAALYNEAEDILLNQQIGTVPINFYRGDYVYDDEAIAVFPQTPLGLIFWEQVQLAE
jgi:ABC-type oligopeptide transport system substrate-binding subunit